MAACPTPGVHTCLDYEYKPNKYSFKVGARDEQGQGQLTSYATLIVNIADVNDNKPEVGDYEVDIFENKTETEPKLRIIVSSFYVMI